MILLNTIRIPGGDKKAVKGNEQCKKNPHYLVASRGFAGVNVKLQRCTL